MCVIEIPQSPLGHGILHVVFLASSTKMLVTHTRWIVAEVHYNIIRPDTFPKPQRHMMRPALSSLYPHLPVSAVTTLSTIPNPALIRRNDLGIEPFLN